MIKLHTLRIIKKIFTQGRSKAINKDKGISIDADNFRYNKISKILNATKNVEINDPFKEFKLNTQNITYFISEGKNYNKRYNRRNS